jgi:hypothetical protein
MTPNATRSLDNDPRIDPPSLALVPKPKRRKHGSKEHRGVRILPPSQGNPHWRLLYANPE